MFLYNLNDHNLKIYLFISQYLIHYSQKESKSTDYILRYISKGLCTSKLNSLNNAFLYRIKLFRYKMGIKFDKDPLVVEQKYYFTKIVNNYIAYDLRCLAKKSYNIFKCRICLFAATSIVNDSDKETSVHSGYGKTFKSTGPWNLDKEFSRYIIIFGADNIHHLMLKIARIIFYC